MPRRSTSPAASAASTALLPGLLVALLLAISASACDDGSTKLEPAAPPPAGAASPSPNSALQTPEDTPDPAGPSQAAQASQASQAAQEGPEAERGAPPPPDSATLARYPWLADESTASARPEVANTLDTRFAPPPGFVRDDVPGKSFGAFLRTLPLASEGTPVKSFAGETILGPDHRNLAAVAAIDIGGRDLQQCADSIVRLHAEWLFSLGKRDHSYRSASGVTLPFSRYLKGERIVLVGKQIEWQKKSSPRSPSHSALRSYLDGVFAWANTGSLARQAKKIGRGELRPGDFFVIPGGPGHAVLILDVARAEDGRIALLLGQGFMPAQSFHVLRPDASGPWFVVAADDESGVDTPFWQIFPWSSLRRLDG